jgi:hypothetical protein
MENIQLHKFILTFYSKSKHQCDFLVRKPLAPNVDHRHLVDLRKEVQVQNTPYHHTPQKDQHVQPKKVSIFITCENESFNLRQRSVGEVHIEEEAKAEFAHEEESSEWSPDI